MAVAQPLCGVGSNGRPRPVTWAPGCLRVPNLPGPGTPVDGTAGSRPPSLWPVSDRAALVVFLVLLALALAVAYVGLGGPL